MSKTYDSRDLKLFFVHHSGGTSQLMNLDMKGHTMEGMIAPKITQARSVYDEDRVSRKINREMTGVTNEVHIYLKHGIEISNAGPIQIDKSQIESINVIKRDGTREFLSVVAVLVGVVFVASIIVFLTKSSCPYVYSFNGEQFVFEGEIFSGAVLHNLERHDYMYLPAIRPTNGKYKVRISNELKEKQFINQAELFVVNHSPKENILFTDDGIPVVIQNEQRPSRAICQNMIDQRPHILKQDTTGFAFDNIESDKQELNLTFQKKPGAEMSTLLIRGKNTQWGDYVFGEFAQKFGNKFNKWKRRQKKMSREERLEGVLNTEMPLTVYLKVGDEWKLVDHVYMVGPLGERDIAVPVELSQHSGREIEIKLTTGFHFWEINYVAMDFEQPQDVQFQTLQIDEIAGSQNYQIETLFKDDDLYLEQKKTSDYTDLTFNEIEVPIGMKQSVFLHCKGYYEHVRNFRGKPDIAELEKFIEPGYFSEFSKEEYVKYISEMESYVASQ